MRNFKLILAYDGGGFSGWQVQPDRDTVQGRLARALWQVTGEQILPQASGRTDAGVHALGQVASFSLKSPIPTENLLRALNHHLPQAIRVFSVEEADREFHARYSAVDKLYRYRIYRGAICSPFLARYVCHHPYRLDERCMTEAAAVLAGEHDFTSFAAVDPEVCVEQAEKSNVRNIKTSVLVREGEELVYEISGNGFLHHMVRNIVGTLLWIGKNALAPSEMTRIIEKKERSAAAATAPAQGLCLISVRYL